MSRLSIMTTSKAQTVVEDLYKVLERRIIASPPGICPVDVSAAFLKMCHAQSCGKCTPCRIGLGQLGNLLDQILDGEGTEETLTLIERTARTVKASSDCAIGQEAAKIVLSGLEGFRDDYMEHIKHNRCLCHMCHVWLCVRLVWIFRDMWHLFEREDMQMRFA